MILYTYNDKGYSTGSINIDPMGKVPPGTFDAPPTLTGEEVARWETDHWTILPGMPAIEPPPVIVPSEITRWQGLTVLNQAGLLDEVEAYVGALTDRQAKIDFTAASVWRRDWSWLENAAADIGLTSEQIDQMFIAAALL